MYVDEWRVSKVKLAGLVLRFIRALFIISIPLICDALKTHVSELDIETDLDEEDFRVARSLDLGGDERLEKEADRVLYNNDKFEGDIDMGGHQIEQYTQPIISNTRPNVQYNAIRSIHHLWPTRRIPYKLSARYNKRQRAVIAGAIDKYHTETCIQFVPKKRSDRDYIFITKHVGCYSSVGRQGGRQIVSLSKQCLIKGVVMHELMHVAGFFHEQSRNDRDDHILIQWENVIPGTETQFQKYPLTILDNLRTDYDYASIMHYSSFAFTRNGRPTIRRRFRGPKLGQRRDFSRTDALKLNRLYRCPGSEPGSTAVRPTTESHSACQDASVFKCKKFAPLCERSAKARRVCPVTCGSCDEAQKSASKRNRASKRKGSSRKSGSRGSRNSGSRSTCGSDQFAACGSWHKVGFCRLQFIRVTCPTSCQTC